MSSNSYHNIGPAIKIETVHGNVEPVTKIYASIKDNKPAPVCFELNAPDPKFTGRKKELNLLEDTIKNYQKNPKSGHNPPAIVVCGLGGVGKTQLLRKFIANNQMMPTSAYYNVVWINSQSISLMLNAFTRLADDLDIQFEKKNEMEDKDLTSLISKVLNKLSISPTLVVFDNVDEDENKKIIKIVLTTGVSGARPHVIITSRIRNWSNSIHYIGLEVFNACDALEYVSSNLLKPAINDSVEALALIELVQNFPLALAQAVAHINHHRDKGTYYNITDYLGEYNESLTETLSSNFFQNDEFNLYDRTTLTTWKVTIAAIKRHGATGELALKILRIMTYFNPDHILRAIFFHLAGIEDVVEAVNLLVNYSMIHSHSEKSVLSIHRLVQQVTKIELEVNSDLTKTILQHGLDIISKMNEDKDFEQCLEHGISVFRAASNIVELVYQYKTFPGILLRRLHDYRKFYQAITFGEEIVKRLASVLEKNDAEILTCKFWLAMSHRSVYNFFESLRIDSEVLEKRKQILGEYHRDTLVSMTNVAIANTNMGRNHEALKMHEEVLEKQIIILENSENSEDQRNLRLDILNSKFCIAILHNKLGRLSESLSMHRQIYEERQRILGDSHPDTLDSMTNIGIAYNHMGRHDVAYKILQTVYYKRIALGLRDDDPHLVHSKTQIALAYRGLERSAEAARIYEQLYERWKNIYGDCPKTLDFRYNIGVMYNKLGRHTEALRIHEEVLKVRGNFFIEDSAYILQCKSMIAESYFLLGKYKEGLEIFEDIYERGKISLGENEDLLILEFRRWAGHCYRNSGEYTKALQIYEENLCEHVKKWGADHIRTLEDQFDVANMYNELGRYNEALQLHREVLEKRQVTLGEDPTKKSSIILPRILDSKSEIAETYNHLGKYNEALQLYQEVLEKRETISTDSLPMLQCQTKIADTYNNLGDHLTACQMHQEVYKQRKNILGENHPHTLDSKFRMAISRNTLGEHYLAHRMHQEVYNQRMMILGKNHLHSLDSKFHIAVSLSSLRQYTLARQKHQEIYEQRRILLGDNHPHTLNSKFHIAISESNLGRHSIARRMHREVYKQRKLVLGQYHPHVLLSKSCRRRRKLSIVCCFRLWCGDSLINWSSERCWSINNINA